jgi:exonuclease III
MRVIFLNALFGQAGKKFLNFVQKESGSTDIFCFMEFSPKLFDETSSLLKDWQGLVEKGLVLEAFGVQDCLSIFVKKNLKVKSSGKILLYRNTGKDTGFAMFVRLDIEGKPLEIVNVHGKTWPGNKEDTPARVRQSEKIIDFCREIKEPKIIGGDFNLNPDTKSIKLFEEVGYKNLIKEFGIKRTRNRLAWNQFKNEPGFVKQYFADYIFTSPEVKVKNFEVPDIEISDHLPLILDFSFDSAQDYGAL